MMTLYFPTVQIRPFNLMSELTKFIRYFFLCFLTILFAGNKIYSQESEFRKTSITTGVGIGFNGGRKKLEWD